MNATDADLYADAHQDAADDPDLLAAYESVFGPTDWNNLPPWDEAKEERMAVLASRRDDTDGWRSL